MKVRAQIQLDSQDYDALKSYAENRGLSISAAVRGLVRDRLREQPKEREERVKRFLAASGSIPGGPDEGTISRDHDRVLYGEPPHKTKRRNPSRR